MRGPDPPHSRHSHATDPSEGFGIRLLIPLLGPGSVFTSFALSSCTVPASYQVASACTLWSDGRAAGHFFLVSAPRPCDDGRSSGQRTRRGQIDFVLTRSTINEVSRLLDSSRILRGRRPAGRAVDHQRPPGRPRRRPSAPASPASPSLGRKRDREAAAASEKGGIDGAGCKPWSPTLGYPRRRPAGRLPDSSRRDKASRI
jgi:hypothetical protein